MISVACGFVNVLRSVLVPEPASWIYGVRLQNVLHIIDQQNQNGAGIEIGGGEGGHVEKAVVTAKGQIVIPAKLRRKLGIKKRALVFIYEKDGERVLKPITDEYIEIMAGVTGTRGKLLNALKKEKAAERVSAPDPVCLG